MPMQFFEPHYEAEAPIQSLRTAELFLVVAFRLWALPQKEPAKTHPDWREGFAAADIPYAGAAAFDCLFRIVAVASTRPVDVRCRNCGHLSPDEALLLQMTAALQRREEAEAREALAQWLPPAAIRTALEPAHILAHTMGMAGLHLPRSPLPATKAQAVHHACAETVH